jgi:hypothetical protein
MLATSYTGAFGFFFFVPGVLLLLALVGLFIAIDGKWWSLLSAALPLLVGGFFGWLGVFFAHETATQLGIFYCFWFPAPFVVALISVIILPIRRRGLRNKEIGKYGA